MLDVQGAASGGAATPDGKPAEPVRFQDLIALLPQLEGWEQEKPTGERMTYAGIALLDPALFANIAPGKRPLRPTMAM